MKYRKGTFAEPVRPKGAGRKHPFIRKVRRKPLMVGR